MSLPKEAQFHPSYATISSIPLQEVFDIVNEEILKSSVVPLNENDYSAIREFVRDYPDMRLEEAIVQIVASIIDFRLKAMKKRKPLPKPKRKPTMYDEVNEVLETFGEDPLDEEEKEVVKFLIKEEPESSPARLATTISRERAPYAMVNPLFRRRQFEAIPYEEEGEAPVLSENIEGEVGYGYPKRRRQRR